MNDNENDFDFYYKLGKKLRSARERIGLSVADLAIKSGVSEKHIETYENASKIIPIYDFLSLARAMNYPPEIEPKNGI